MLMREQGREVGYHGECRALFLFLSRSRVCVGDVFLGANSLFSSWRGASIFGGDTTCCTDVFEVRVRLPLPMRDEIVFFLSISRSRIISEIKQLSLFTERSILEYSSLHDKFCL